MRHFISGAIGFLALLGASPTLAGESAHGWVPPAGASAEKSGGEANGKGGDPAYIVLGAGAYDFHREATVSPEFSLSYRSDYKLWVFKPHAGILATGDGAVYGWGGLLVDFDLGKNWVLTPSTAVGGYHQGRGKDLGSVLEFRSGLDLAYRFENRSRLGAGIYHISNAGTGRRNPGEETAILSYSLPVSQLFK
ncbi:MAG: acyloxyacyl hydrolase [Alphaproteobacteria bacterium]